MNKRYLEYYIKKYHHIFLKSEIRVRAQHCSPSENYRWLYSFISDNMFSSKAAEYWRHNYSLSEIQRMKLKAVEEQDYEKAGIHRDMERNYLNHKILFGNHLLLEKVQK